MAAKISEHSCDDCGVCYGDYHSDCSWGNLCEVVPGFLRGWKPRTENGSENGK